MNPSCPSLNSIHSAYVVLNLFHAQEVPHAHAQLFSRVQFFATTQTVAHRVPLSIESSGKEYQSGQTSPSPGDGLDPGIKPWSLALQADSLPSEPQEKPTLKDNCLITSINIRVHCLEIFFYGQFLFHLHNCQVLSLQGLNCIQGAEFALRHHLRPTLSFVYSQLH